MHLDESAIVEFEVEKMRKESKPETNIDVLPSKRLNYGRIFLFLAFGILLFRAITQLFHFIF